MNKIQSLEIIRSLIDHQYRIANNSKKYLDILEDAYKTLHDMVEADAQDFHFCSRIEDQIENGDMVSYNSSYKSNGYEIKVLITPIEKD